MTESGKGKLQDFPGLKNHEKRAVMLKADGKTYEQIKEHINDEFALEHSLKTVQEWFRAGGRLEQAYTEYIGAMAAASLKEAKLVIMRSMKAAAAVLISKMNDPDGRLALDAAKSLLNKYVPDKQISLSAGYEEEELPPELDLAAQEVMDGPQPVDDPQKSGADNPAPGP